MKGVVKKQVKYWFPVYVWAALVFYLSLTPSVGPSISSVGRTFMIADHYKHMLSYGFLTFLLWRSFRNSKLRYSEVLAVMIAIIYGAFIELNQFFVPGRVPSVFDAFFNLVGCVLIQPLIMLYKKIPRIKKG